MAHKTGQSRRILTAGVYLSYLAAHLTGDTHLIWYTVQYGQQCPCQSQQVAEPVETEIDQVTTELYHLADRESVTRRIDSDVTD